jgi:hypothetical protein
MTLKRAVSISGSWRGRGARRLDPADGWMPFIRSGSVVQQRSFLEELLDLPYQLYALVCFFFATLFNVRPLPLAAAAWPSVLTSSALPCTSA